MHPLAKLTSVDQISIQNNEVCGCGLQTQTCLLQISRSLNRVPHLLEMPAQQRAEMGIAFNDLNLKRVHRRTPHNEKH